MTFFQLPSCFTLPQRRQEVIEADVDDDKCQECSVPLQRKDVQTKICPRCGLESASESENSLYTHDSAKSYNCGNTTHIPFKVVGNTVSAIMQNNLMRRISDYPAYKTRRITNKVMKWVLQVPDECDNIPLTVVTETVRAYCELQEENKLVKRAGGLDAVLAYIIYNKCAELGVPRKPKTIVSITGISDNQLSDGERTIDKLKGQTIIDETITDSCSDYIELYFEKLNIEYNERHRGFVTDLIANSRLDKIRTPGNSAIMTTRCAGSIYILASQIGLGITKEDIEFHCNIAKGTFMRFVVMITTHKEKKCIRKVFDQYEVPHLA